MQNSLEIEIAGFCGCRSMLVRVCMLAIVTVTESCGAVGRILGLWCDLSGLSNMSWSESAAYNWRLVDFGNTYEYAVMYHCTFFGCKAVQYWVLLLPFPVCDRYGKHLYSCSPICRRAMLMVDGAARRGPPTTAPPASPYCRANIPIARPLMTRD